MTCTMTRRGANRARCNGRLTTDHERVNPASYSNHWPADCRYNIAMADYEPRYLGGIVCFNDRDFFEAHEVWEGMWLEMAGPERRFVQGLIQAAVALYHFGNGNLRGAVKLYHSSRDYMSKFGSRHWGLDIAEFCSQMERCFAEALAATEPAQRPQLCEELIPTIVLDPPPASWPDAGEFVEKDE